MSQLMKRLQSSLLREDMRSNPVSALVKRFWWKLRWRIRKDDWPLTLDNGLRLSAPHSGAAALIYYLGSSEPTTTVLLNHHLRPGMVVIDIGAHLGEYTLRASQLVGKTGQVHAFEPDPMASYDSHGKAASGIYPGLKEATHRRRYRTCPGELRTASNRFALRRSQGSRFIIDIERTSSEMR